MANITMKVVIHADTAATSLLSKFYMKTKISIIVPVYNTGKYLEKCLESIKNQTLSDIEIICINDGSNDDSKQIIENYVLTDSRFKLINQNNKGQSAARNTGIEKAQGEYIGFVDSDDFIDSKMYETLYNNAKKNDTDISMCSFIMHDDKNNKESQNDPYMSLNIFPKKLENVIFDYNQTLDFIFRICVSPCNKIYKNDFIKNSKFKFIENLNYEDNVFFLDAYTSAKRVSIIKEPLYFYRYTSDTSISHSNKYDEKKLDFFKIFELEEEILKEKNIYSNIKDYFEKSKKNTLIYWYKKIENDNIKQIFKTKFENLYGNSEGLC